MSIHLPPDEQNAAEHLVALGEFRSVEEVVIESVRRLVSGEKLPEQAQTGIDQADRGELLDHNTVFAEFRSLAAASDIAAQ